MTSFVEIPLTRGFVALVDAADFPLVGAYRWQASVVRKTPTSVPHVSAIRTVESKGTRRFLYMHREIMGAGPRQIVDHVNRNPLDNRRANLRFCSTSGNTANRIYSNPLGFRGVFQHRGRFGFQISAGRENGRKKISRSGFASVADAARAYDAAARDLHGEFAVLNFPNEHRAPPEPAPSIA